MAHVDSRYGDIIIVVFFLMSKYFQVQVAPRWSVSMTVSFLWAPWVKHLRSGRSPLAPHGALFSCFFHGQPGGCLDCAAVNFFSRTLDVVVLAPS